MLQIRPSSRRALGVYCLLASLLVAIYLLRNTEPTIRIDDGKWVIASGPYRKERPKLHMFLSDSQDDVNLCKTILSATVLSYPTPNLLAGNATLESRYNLTGIPRTARIFHVLDHLQRLKPAADKDLVLVVESSDIWFQLRPETLVDRYVTVNSEANQRIAERIGGAAYVESIKQSILFGARKRCVSGDSHSLACYTAPESSAELGKPNSLRHRYLESGFILGPVGDMKAMFLKAAERAQSWPTSDPDSEAVFSTMFGEQECQRELLRQQHETVFERLHTKAFTRKPKSVGRTTSDVEKRTGDSESSSSSSQTRTTQPGVNYEFGIGLDYYSDLGHATVDAEVDGRWLRYSESLATLRSQARADQNGTGCKYSGTGELPEDIMRSRLPFAIEAGPGVSLNRAWTQLPLYTNVCTDRVPVMIQHNGDKSAQEANWPRLWLQQRARALLQPKIYAENNREYGTDKGIKAKLEIPYEAASEDYHTRLGAFTDDGAFKSWDQLCPSSFSPELFRDQKAG